MGSKKIKQLFLFCFLLFGFLFIPAPLVAKDGQGWEFRLGLYNHGIITLDSNTREGGLDINLEAQAPPLLKGPWGGEYLRWRLGATLSLLEKTHIFYSGFAFELSKPIAPFFLGVGLDMAIHTGKRTDNDDNFNKLGCRWAFHESLTLGLIGWQHHRIMVTLEHISNAKSTINACPFNSGLSNVGARYSYRF